MKISELIESLAEVQSKYGDIDVYIMTSIADNVYDRHEFNFSKINKIIFGDNERKEDLYHTLALTTTATFDRFEDTSDSESGEATDNNEGSTTSP